MKGYRLHGRNVRSEIPLPALAQSSGTDWVEIRVRSEERLAESPEWSRLAARDTPHRVRIWQTPDLFVVDLDVVQFQIHSNLRQIDVIPRTDCPPDLVPTLTWGFGLSVLLALDGKLVLHASAVAKEGSAIGFVGPRGAGKSTLAAALTHAGWALLAEDVLHVQAVGPEHVAHRGAVELRLRDFAKPLGEVLGGNPRATADQRIGILPASVHLQGEARLAALLVPHFSDAPAPRIVELSGRDALLAVLKNLRVGSWCCEPWPSTQLQLVAELVRTTRILELRVPRREVADLALSGQLAASLSPLIERPCIRT